MSALKYQLRELLPSLSAEANKISDREIKQRFYLIKGVCESKKSVKKSCEARGFSTDFFNKWGKRLVETKSVKALATQSKSPKSFWNVTPKRIIKRVIKYKKEFPFRGPESISFYLKKMFNMVCKPSTIYDILKRHNLISKEYRKQRTKRHLLRYRRPWPGHLQLDIKYVPYPVDGRQCYQISAIDHHSSWRLIRTYARRTLKEVIDFLDELEKNCPFEMVQIQTDNATEFTDKFSSQRGLRPTEFHLFDEWCRKRSIHHKLIPLGEKEINGKVENSHKWDDEEFYSQKTFETLAQLQAETIAYNEYWNKERYTKTLGWKTPEQVVGLAYVRAAAYMMYLNKRFPEEKKERIWTDSGYVIRSKTRTKLQPKEEKEKKPKKITAVDRYLQWMDWDQKNKLKSLVPLIFPIYS